MFCSRLQIHKAYAYSRTVTVQAKAPRKYLLRVPRTKMPVVIQPTVSLDVENVPLEKEIYDAHVANTLDHKNLFVIGYMAIQASLRHVRADGERRDLSIMQEAYNKMISELKKDFSDRADNMASRIIADKDKDLALTTERLQSAHKTSEAYYVRIIAEKDQELAFVKDKLDQTKNNVELLISHATTQKANEVAQLREQVLSQRLAADSETEKSVAILKERWNASQQRITELEAALHESKENARLTTQEMMKTFKDEEIAALHAQISALKGSNFSKGVVGENSVKHWLMSTFTDCEIQDKSGIAAESDIHVVRANGEFIAVECKNKAMITVQDVDKSIRDIHYLREKYGGKFAGYIFVSLRSTNIPRKGNGTLELIDDMLPVYWYGQHEFNEDDHTVVDFCKAIWSISACVRSMRSKFSSSDDAIDTLKRQLTDMLTLFRQTLDRLNQNQKTIAALVTNAKSVQENNNFALQILNDYIASNALDGALLSVNSQQHICNKCDRVFARKSDLTKHVAKCLVHVPQP